MSDTEQKAVPIYKPRQRGRLIGAAIVLCVLALLVALTFWSTRPRWYTFVSKGTTTKHRVALVLRVPVGWECQEHGTNGFVSTVAPFTIEMRPRPLTGIARWWGEHILHLDSGPKADVRYSVSLMEGQYLYVYEEGFVQSLKIAGYAVTSRTFEHSLGTAFTVNALWRGPGNPAQGSPVLEGTLIAVSEHPDAVIMAGHAGVSADSNRNQATWNEILRSIRVVQE